MVETITQSQVEILIRDWRKRLNLLFGQIESWAARFPNHPECTRTSTPHALGHLTEQYDLKPVKLPSLTVKSEKCRFRFYPSALSMLGANGRVDVFRKSTYLFQIIDRGKDGKSEWQIVGKDARHNLTLLTEESLRKNLEV